MARAFVTSPDDIPVENQKGMPECRHPPSAAPIGAAEEFIDTDARSWATQLLAVSPQWWPGGSDPKDRTTFHSIVSARVPAPTTQRTVLVSLWTPDGERPVARPSQSDHAAANSGASPELRAALAEAGIDFDSLSPEQQAEAAQMLTEMSRVRQEMLSVPATDIIANHLMGFYELAAIHLGENPPNFGEATIAIEALRAVLDRLGEKFGEHHAVLAQALTQLQMTFVQLKEQIAEHVEPTE